MSSHNTDVGSDHLDMQDRGDLLRQFSAQDHLGILHKSSAPISPASTLIVLCVGYGLACLAGGLLALVDGDFKPAGDLVRLGTGSTAVAVYLLVREQWRQGRLARGVEWLDEVVPWAVLAWGFGETINGRRLAIGLVIAGFVIARPRFRHLEMRAGLSLVRRW